MTTPAAQPTPRPLHEIADDIFDDWVTMAANKNHPAHPYADALRSLDGINDLYGADSARGIVQYFLSNAAGWSGATARAVKAELKALSKK
jgi:hypothetical protein